LRDAATSLVVALALFAAPFPAAGDRSLTLDEAVALALQNYEGISIERESLVAAEAGMTGAKGAYDPLLDLRGGWLQSRQPVNSAFSGATGGKSAPEIEAADAGAALLQLLPTGGAVSVRATASRETTDGAFALLSPAYFTRVGVELRQPLLRDRAVDAARTGLSVTASERDRARASLRRETADSVAAVETAYWRLSGVRLAVAVREEAVRLAEEQLSETRIRIEGGALPENEIAQPRAELERRSGELYETREEVSRADNTLKILILEGTDVDRWSEPIVPADDVRPDVVPVDLTASIDRALASRPELAAAEADLERQRAQSSFARDGVRPVLDLVVSYDRFGMAGSRNPAAAAIPGLPTEVPENLQGGLGRSFATLGDGQFDDVRAAVVFQIPIGNRAGRAAEAAAGSAERQAEAELARVRKLVLAEVLDAAAAVETAGQRIEASRSAREAAEVQLSSEQERYAVGLSTNFLVLTRQNDLSSARLDEIEALIDYRNARTEMARATGMLLAERRIEVRES
jgi:HAE1 family hydrophobic/amphiphilic exporter-1